jgi:replication-associated recombination protein RarA
MIPPTKNGLPAMVCISMMQKAIRRGMEKEAMEAAVELLHSSKAFLTMVANRLEICSHEDIDTHAAPWIIPFVAVCTEQAKRHYDARKVGRARMMIGSAVRALARAPKSRLGDHFAASLGLASELEGYKPQLADWAYDMHTSKGRAMGRGLDHFRTEGAKLVPPPTGDDPYIDEAYRLWAKKAALGSQKPAADLFDEEA